MADARAATSAPRRWSGPAHVAAELSAEERTEAGTRGSLVVKDRAVERIAEAAVLEVSGVVGSGDSAGTIATALGRAYPRVAVQVAGRRATVEVDVVTRWPRPAAQVAAAVREHVAGRLNELADLDVDVVHVEVAKVVRPTTPEREARPVTLDTNPGTGSAAAGERTPMRAATQKSGSGPIGAVGPVLAVLLLALGALLLREALVAAGALSGRAWLPAAVDGLEGFSPARWLIPVGIVLALVGLWLVVTALRPRSRRTLALDSRTGVFLHTRDVARLASGAATDVDGVLEASSTATRKKVVVTAHATAEAGLRESITDAVTDRLSALQSPPRVSVTVRTPKEN